MRPVIKRWKIWAITIIGGSFGAGIQTSGFSVYGTGGFNISLMGAIEGAILIDLGYLLIVWVLSNGFQFKRRENLKTKKEAECIEN